MSDAVYTVVDLNANPQKNESEPDEVTSKYLGNETGRKTGFIRHHHQKILCCMLLVCLIPLPVIISLSMKWSGEIQENRRLYENYNMLTTEKEQLQKKYSMLTTEKEELQKKYSMLTTEKEELQKNNKMLADEKTELQQKCSIVDKNRTQLERNYKALFKKLPYIQKYCHTTEKGQVCESCPQGWKNFSSKCYWFSTNEMTWNESQNNCSKEGAHLVIIDSQEEQGFIGRETNSYWIGLSDTATEGVWLWVDGSEFKNDKFSSKWMYEEPNNKDQESPNQSANCVITRQTQRWSDESCQDKHRWICETDMLVT